MTTVKRHFFIQHSPSCIWISDGTKSKKILILARKQSSYLGCSSETSHLQNCRIKDRTDLDVSSYHHMVKQTQEHQWGQSWWGIACDSSQICSIRWTISSRTSLCAKEHVKLEGPYFTVNVCLRRLHGWMCDFMHMLLKGNRHIWQNFGVSNIFPLLSTVLSLKTMSPKWHI